ncbi:MAG: ATP-dependent zinc protease family protein [Methyloligellaceae bacterium]
MAQVHGNRSGSAFVVLLGLLLLSLSGAPAADAQDQRTKGAVPPNGVENTAAGPALPDRGLELGEPLPVWGYDVIGFIETVRITAAKLDVNAKIDSGARTSSIDARRIEPFMRDGAQWVRFTLHGDADQSRRMEHPVRRVARIKRVGAASQKRYVVMLGLCVGSFYRVSEVNLTDRSRMRYRMILGRHYMMERFLIDPAALFLTEPNCPKQP